MNDVVSKKVFFNALYGFYYSLLTPKQQEIFEYYYSDDYSISEIAETLAISRNAVWDSLQKTTALLEDYENKLALYQNSQKLNMYFTELEKYTNDEGKIIIQKMKEME